MYKNLTVIKGLSEGRKGNEERKRMMWGTMLKYIVYV
jgi:hypothetical protein